MESPDLVRSASERFGRQPCTVHRFIEFFRKPPKAVQHSCMHKNSDFQEAAVTALGCCMELRIITKRVWQRVSRKRYTEQAAGIYGQSSKSVHTIMYHAPCTMRHAPCIPSCIMHRALCRSNNLTAAVYISSRACSAPKSVVVMKSRKNASKIETWCT